MSDLTAEARQAAQSTNEVTLQRAALYAQIAQAEALERIADLLVDVTDEDSGKSLLGTVRRW